MPTSGGRADRATDAIRFQVGMSIQRTHPGAGNAEGRTGSLSSALSPPENPATGFRSGWLETQRRSSARSRPGRRDGPSFVKAGRFGATGSIVTGLHRDASSCADPIAAILQLEFEFPTDAEAHFERRFELGCSSGTLGDQPLRRIAISDGGVITVARPFLGRRWPAQ